MNLLLNISIDVHGQNLKNNLAIWSHWSSPMKNLFCQFVMLLSLLCFNLWEINSTAEVLAAFQSVRCRHRWLSASNDMTALSGFENKIQRIWKIKTFCQTWAATIAQWIRLCLPSCGRRFNSQAHHLCFHSQKFC